MRENHLKWIVQKYGLKVLNGFKGISMQFNDGFLYSKCLTSEVHLKQKIS